MFDLYTIILWLTGLMVVNGVVIYIVFYELLGRMYWKKLVSPSRIKEDVVMCGLEYSEETLSVPVSRVFMDIIKRSFPRASRIIEEGGGTSLLNNWFAWMLILLAVLLVILVVAGWI
ncbi:MAG: hypothetical protein J7J82_08725 [Staphylothermus sp.]|nr:hypothetical protein [Staphylothermus sp.]